MDSSHNNQRLNSMNRGNSYNPYLQRHPEVFRYKHSGSSGSSSWILWGSNNKKSKKSKTSQKCCGILLATVIVIVLLLVITIAALAIYMGALKIDSQHLELIFDTTFRVTAGDNYYPSLQNSTSSLYKEKSKRYKSMLEKIYNTSVLSPAIKYCGVIGFKSGSLIVFYRIILDRRKIPRSLNNIEDVVKHILLDEITSSKPVAFKNIKVDLEDIQIKRYFGVSLTSFSRKKENASLPEHSVENLKSSTNLDDENRIVTIQSHSSSSITPPPISPLFSNQKKYSTSHIQRKVTPNIYEHISSLETDTTSDKNPETPPNKSAFGSFTVFDNSNFGDVFTSVATPKPISNNKMATSLSVQNNKPSTISVNKYSSFLEVLDDSDIEDPNQNAKGNNIPTFQSHENILQVMNPDKKGKITLSPKNTKSTPMQTKNEISGVGEAQVVVLPASSSSHELLNSAHETTRSQPTTYRPHTSRSKQTTLYSLPPETIVTTESRSKTTPVYSLKLRKNEVQKETLVLKSNQKLPSIKPKEEDSPIVKKNDLHPDEPDMTSDIEEESEMKSITSFLKSEFPILKKFNNLDEVLRAYMANKTANSSNQKKTQQTTWVSRPHDDGLES